MGDSTAASSDAPATNAATNKILSVPKDLTPGATPTASDLQVRLQMPCYLYPAAASLPWLHTNSHRSLLSIFSPAVLNRPSQTRVRHQGRPTRERRGGRLDCHEQRRAGDKRCHEQDTLGAQRPHAGCHPDGKRSAGALCWTTAGAPLRAQTRATPNVLLPLFCCCPSCLGNKLPPTAPCF